MHTAVVTHGRFYLIDTQALDNNDNRKEVQNNSRRLRAACRCESDQGGSGRFSPDNSSAGMVLTVLSWPQVYFSWWHFSVMSLVCLLQIWVMTRLLGSNSLQYLVSDDRRLLLHTWNRRLTLNTEHLADFQRSTADFTKSADDSFSVGFREEGTTVQNGLFIT